MFNRTPFNRTAFNRRASLAREVLASATLAGASEVAVGPPIRLRQVPSGAVEFRGDGGIAAPSRAVRGGQASLAGYSQLQSQAIRKRNAKTNLQGISALSAPSPIRTRMTEAILEGLSSLSPRATRVRIGIGWLRGEAATSFAGGFLIQGAASFYGSGTMDDIDSISHRPEIIRIRVRGVAAKRLVARGVAAKRFVVR